MNARARGADKSISSGDTARWQGAVLVFVDIDQSPVSIAVLGQTDAQSMHVLQNIVLMTTFLPSPPRLMTLGSGHALIHIPQPLQAS